MTSQRLVRIATASIAAIAAGITIWGLFPPSVAKNIPNQAIAAADGYFYINLPAGLRYAELRPDSNERPNRSSLRLYENGAQLGPAHSLHADITQHGHGLPLARRANVPMRNYPNNYFAKLSPKQRRLVMYDQLNPAYAKYYTGIEARRLLEEAGFINVRLHHRHGYSWAVLGERP